MLVLTRKVREQVLIGENIVLTVVRRGRDRVWIGVNAPPEVPIRTPEQGESAGPGRGVTRD